MFEIPLLLILIVLVALVFDFTNGAHDCANAIATVVSTKVVTPRFAVGMAAALNLAGALLGTEVAKTLGAGLVLPEVVQGSHILVLAALLGAIFWNCLTWYFGIPSSSSHALIGGLVGAALAHAGPDALNFAGIVNKVLLPLVLSPLAGFGVGFLIMWLIYWIFARVMRSKVNRIFRKIQLVSAAFMATSHGLNDAQKTMGIIALTLIAVGLQPSGSGPQLWVIAVCGLAIALGTYMGGWRVIRTLGKGLTEIATPQGFAAEASSATTILVSSHLGFALSTTQVCSGSIIGSGLGKKGGAIDWKVAARMLIAWLVTFPAAGVIGAAACAVAKINVWGTLAVAAIAVVAALIIFRLSRRNPVNAMNVNEGSEVKVNAKVATAAAAA